MNSHTFTILGYYQLLELIAGHAQSALAQELVRAIRPKTELAAIQAHRGLYADCMALQETTLSLPSLRIEDLGELLREIAPDGSIAVGSELLPCRAALDATFALHQFIHKDECAPFASIQRLCAPLDPCNQLRNDLTRCLDHDGSVLDNASPRLHDLRRSIISTELRIQRTLDQLVHSSELGSPDQQKFVTMRNGRYVVPIRKDAHTSVSGIVHDVSQTGQTMFVEPTATVGMGNELAKQRAEERDEVRRILAMLTGQVRRAADTLRQNQRIIAELDAARAVADWGLSYRCTLPCFGGVMAIREARHPLLTEQFRRNGRGEKVVPLTLALDAKVRTLAITGSNTGGKTIALKTIGLITLAAQSGFPVPVSPDSLFTIFQNILADIGDEQSIEANLSTYSGHIATISGIVRTVADNAPSLVLLDELGSGTDPLEGGAIACGVLDELARHKTLTIVTTHLGMVKNYVQQQPAMMNAAVRFDLETLRPLYILDIGRPGASHALHIAKRLGLPETILKNAEKLLSGEQLRLEDMLAKMEQDQKRLADQARQAQAASDELIARRDQLRKELENLKNDRKKLVNDAYSEAAAIVENTRRDMENLIRSIHEQARRKGTDAKIDSEAARQALAEKQRKLETGQRLTAPKRPQPLKQDTLTPGRKVWVEKLQAHGRIEQLSGNKVTVNVDGVSFTMKAAELQEKREDDERETQKNRLPTVKVSLPTVQGQTSTELNLIGKRVADALLDLEHFINQAVMARLTEVRIIHGFGTGQLRTGLHGWLRTCPAVQSFHLGRPDVDPGGGGATIVFLKR